MCPADSCSLFGTACPIAVSLRVVEVATDTELFDDCVRLDGPDLCSLGDLDLGGEIFPNTMVKIQVAIWPHDDDTADCPAVEFDLAGKYKSGTPKPALAGEGYFHVGTSGTASVVLGCIDVEAIDAESCQMITKPQITARVKDFAENVEVPNTFIDRLTVSVAEPNCDIVFPGQCVLRSQELVELEARIAGTLVWEGEYPFPFTESACLQVLSDDLGAAATVRCYPAAPADLIDNQFVVEGTLVDDATLDLIRQALGGEPLPNSGLVVGKVFDHLEEPASGVEVTPSYGTIQYLSSDLSSIDPGNRTTSSGVFVSSDANYTGPNGETNFWTATNDIVESVGVVIGGRVGGKVTVVILRLDDTATPR